MRLRHPELRNLSSLIVLTVSLIRVSAESPAWEWLRGAGGDGFDIAHAIAVDAGGNSYVTGEFQQTATFGQTQLTAQGLTFSDIFVAKYDPAGALLWVRGAGGSSADAGYGVAVDGVGNVYVTGFFQSTATFGSTTLTNAGVEDIFLAKYDSAGNVLWARRAGGTGQDFGRGVSVVGTNCFVVGAFRSTATFAGNPVISAGVYDAFVAKYDSTGNLLWVRKGGGTGDDQATAVTTDSAGNCLVAGYFVSPSLTFNGLNAVNSSDSRADVFVVKYDSNGNALWLRTAGGVENDRALAIAADNSGGFRLAGVFASTNAMFGLLTVTNRGDDDAFLARYNGNGEVSWIRSAGGAERDVGAGVAVDPAGNSHWAGNFVTAAAFGAITITNTGGIGKQGMFVARYDANGVALWAKASAGDNDDTAYGIALDALGRAYIAGSIQSSSFHLDQLNLSPSGGAAGIMVARLGEELPRLDADIVGATTFVSWPAYHSGFVLEAVGELASGSTWMLVTNAPALVGERFVVTDPFVPGRKFYRLRKL